MNFIRKYWLIEIGLGLIAIVGLGISAVRAFNNAYSTETETTTIVESDVVVATEANEVAAQTDEQDEEGERSEEFEVESEEAGDNEGEEGEGDEENEDDTDPLAIALQTAGLDPEIVERELGNGRSLAEIAQSSGVDPQQLIAPLIQAELALIESELQAGEITAEEAQDGRNETETWVPFWVNTPYTDPQFIVAKTLNLDIDTIWEAIGNNQTIQELAQTQSIDPQTVIAAIIASETAYAQAMVEAGLIDPEDLSETREEIATWANKMVTLPEAQWEADDGEEEEEEEEEGGEDE